MKTIFQGILLTVLILISFKCQKELSVDQNFATGAGNESAPIISTLQGNVTDENDRPAAGVKISVGTKSTITNSHGYFRIADASLDKNSSVVFAEQSGYFKAYRSFKATTGVNQVVIKLIKKSLAGSVNATAGGEAALPNGAKVSLQANGIVSASGSAYSGAVQVYATYIDPSSNEIGKTIPGSLMGDDKNNTRRVLASYGMLAVELESATGDKLQVAPDKTATLTIPIPASGIASAPASISLWYIDEQSGIWKEQGTAKKMGSNYVGEVKHFSYWNCDIGLPAVGFSAILKTSENIALKNVYVTVHPIVNGTDTSTAMGGVAHGYTDSLGQVAGLVPSNLSLLLEVRDECYNVVYTKNIGPFSQTTDLGTIVIPNSVSSLVTIKGKLLSCSNTAVSNGFAILTWNNFISYVNTDKEGRFSTSFLNCAAAPQTLEILGVDAATQQQGSTLTIPVTPSLTDVGNIVACGTSSVQFINYTLDGTDFFLSNANDSLISFNTYGSGNLLNNYVQGIRYPEAMLTFNFTSEAAAGVYPVSTLGVNNYQRIEITRPFNVTVTSFPAQSGEFYEGNFLGSFVDSTGVSVKHTINGSFRIRKY